eukprot:TRINITY_DN50007_c0_g1_i1.p1 TRINITY_DN50007_c0_g1~~TRINITY_DN50007_c0_g1_i1.p1  ORF type:complete len:170 (+),score=13.68 TRINITY_DN50007_c0_g1_i1:9-518(+)
MFRGVSAFYTQPAKKTCVSVEVENKEQQKNLNEVINDFFLDNAADIPGSAHVNAAPIPTTLMVKFYSIDTENEGLHDFIVAMLCFQWAKYHNATIKLNEETVQRLLQNTDSAVVNGFMQDYLQPIQSAAMSLKASELEENGQDGPTESLLRETEDFQFWVKGQQTSPGL